MKTFMPQANRLGAEEKHKSDYENRIFWRMVVLVTVPLAIVGILSGANYYAEETARSDQMLESTRQNAETQIEGVLNNLRDYYLSAGSNKNFQWLQATAATPYSSYSDLVSAQELLRGGPYMSDYVSGYEYINLQKGWVLDNRGMFRLDDAKNKGEIIRFAAQQNSSSLALDWVNNTQVAAPQAFSNTVDLSGMLLVLRTTSSVRGVVSLLVARLDLGSVSKMVAGWGELGYQLVMLDRNGTLVMATDDALAQAMLAAPPAAGVSNLDGWRVAAGVEASNGMVYYLACKATQPVQIAGTALLISLIAILATVAVLLLCRATSAFLYRPVAELLGTVNDVFGQRQTGQDEFTYLATGVNRLAQDQRTLQNMVVLQRRQLKEQFVLHMLRSEVSLPAIEHTLQEFGIAPCRCYALLTLNIGADPAATGPEREALALTVVQQMPRELTRKLFICPTVADFNLVLIVGAESEDALAATVQTLYKGTMQVIRTGFGLPCVAGVSCVFHTLAHVRAAYHESLEALRYRSDSLPAGQGIIHYYAAGDDDHVKNGYDLLLENEITAAVTACNKKETNRLLGFFLARLDEKGIRGYERQFYLQRLVSAILSVAENAGLSVNKVLKERPIGLFDSIGKIFASDKMQTFLMDEVAVPVMELLTKFRQDTSSELVKNVIALIKQTGGDLTLNECADKLNYHPSYIWKVLKAERDTNFTDLINSQKLEMAKELLLTTDMTVAQVAETLHYANVQNFIRFFNKEVGMTPGRYKKEHQLPKKKK